MASSLKGQRRSMLAAVLMVLCLVMVTVAGGKAWTAYGEKASQSSGDLRGGW